MDKQLAAAKIVQECYSTGRFEKMIAMLTDDFEHHSFWVRDARRGKAVVIPYYLLKGKAIRESGEPILTFLGRISDHPGTLRVGEVNVNGETVRNARVRLWGDHGKACVWMHQEVNGEGHEALAIPTVNDEGKMTRLLITEPSLFDWYLLEVPFQTEDEKAP